MADIKSESRPASNRNRWPASYWNAWPASSESATATMRANQLRLWLASFAYVLICALRRVGLAHTQFAEATCGTIRLKLLKLAGLVRISARRIKFALASACPYADEWRLAAVRLA